MSNVEALALAPRPMGGARADRAPGSMLSRFREPR